MPDAGCRMPDAGFKEFDEALAVVVFEAWLESL